MPNSNHYALCPFYLSEDNKPCDLIRCEDTNRIFPSRKALDDYMHQYCDDEWMACQYAQALIELWERVENMTEEKKRYELLKAKYKATKAELQKVTRKFSVAQKRVRDLNLKIDQMKEHESKATQEIMALAEMYEARFCYLILRAEMEVFSQDAFDKWAKEHEWALVAIDDKTYKVVLKDDESGDNTGSAGVDEKASRKEIGKADEKTEEE